MEIQVFDTRGMMIAGRYLFLQRENNDLAYIIASREPGLYVVNIMIDDIVKTKKLTLN